MPGVRIADVLADTRDGAMTEGVTKAWVAQQAMKAACPVVEGWRDGALTIFVPGVPKHFKGRGHRYTVSRHTKNWRERTASRLLAHCSGWAPREMRFIVACGFATPWPWRANAPKRITFTVYTSGRGFDDDNLELVASPCRDALKDMRIIDDDTPAAGHCFTYAQVTKAAVVGIAMAVATEGSQSPPLRATPGGA